MQPIGGNNGNKGLTSWPGSELVSSVDVARCGDDGQ